MALADCLLDHFRLRVVCSGVVVEPGVDREGRELRQFVHQLEFVQQLFEVVNSKLESFYKSLGLLLVYQRFDNGAPK